MAGGVMGMFDTVHFLGDEAPRCAEGHEVRDLQTKDLDCAMRHFYVFEGQVHEDGRTNGTFDEPLLGLIEVERDGDDLLLVRRERLRRCARTIEAQVYASCEACTPVLTLGEGSFSRDLITEHQPWYDWALTIVGGRVSSLQPIRARTREDLRQELLERGLEVLDDDERLARRHLALREEHGRRRSRWP